MPNLFKEIFICFFIEFLLEMDEILGVAKGLVSKWECGIRKPSGWLFCCWADALGMQITLTPKVQNNDNKS